MKTIIMEVKRFCLNVFGGFIRIIANICSCPADLLEQLIALEVIGFLQHHLDNCSQQDFIAIVHAICNIIGEGFKYRKIIYEEKIYETIFNIFMDYNSEESTDTICWLISNSLSGESSLPEDVVD